MSASAITAKNLVHKTPTCISCVTDRQFALSIEATSPLTHFQKVTTLIYYEKAPDRMYKFLKAAENLNQLVFGFNIG